MIRYERWKIVAIFLVCFGAILYALPNVLPPSFLGALPSWLPVRQVPLGLDLRGGSHLLLEIDMKAVRADQLNQLVENLRVALRVERVGYSDLQLSGDTVTFKLREQADRDRIVGIIRKADQNVTPTVAADGTVSVAIPDKVMEDKRRAAIEQSLEIVRRRIDESGTREPNIQIQGQDRILVQLPGVDDPERIKALLGKTAKLAFRLVDQRASSEDLAAGRAPPGSEILYQQDSKLPGSPKYPIAVQRRVIISGENLVDSQPSFNNAEPVVTFKFDGVGSRRFGEATTENVGKPFAIVLDNQVISAPNIREPILGGSGIITGGFTTQAAQDLALLLRAGALPAPLTVLEERTVGPGLGADSIAAGINASILGLILVAGFMLLAYGLFGIFANIALIFNMAIIMSALAALGATLTLPGIAGIVLTMGMAVDANVLIYERMREEVRNGRSVVSAIDAGFKRAFGTIFDSNFTHLIAAFLMFSLGSGPVRGFAVTLAIGVATSLFTAVTVTRYLVVLWLQTRPKALPI